MKIMSRAVGSFACGAAAVAAAGEDAGMHAGRPERNAPVCLREIRGNFFRDTLMHTAQRAIIPEDLKKNNFF